MTLRIRGLASLSFLICGLAAGAVGQPAPAADWRNSTYSQGLLIRPSAEPVTEAGQWQANVAALDQELPARHSLPFPGISLDGFHARAAALYDEIPSLSPVVIRTRLQQLVAAVKDGHTDIYFPTTPDFRFLPLQFYWFDDGIYVRVAAAGYTDLLGGKLLAVGETPMEGVISTMAGLVPTENLVWVKSRLPRILQNADFLHGTGLIPSTASAPLTIRTQAGETVQVEVATVSAPPSFSSALPMDTTPLYLKNTNRNYWATGIDGGATIYFQYNRCREDPNLSSADFLAQLDQMLAQPGVQRLVVDMRLNNGGFAFLDSWIVGLKNTRFNQPGRLYVITGRETFSAAMEAAVFFQDRTKAIFVGEPTGGKPRFQLRRGDFQLPYFGVSVSYSVGQENASNPDPTQVPDVLTGLTLAQYMSGEDLALEAILRLPLPGDDPKTFRPAAAPDDAVVNGASYAAGITPGSIASLFGTNLADGVASAGASLPLSLGGVAVTVNGISAPLYFVSPGQINFQVPWEVQGEQEVYIRVTGGGALRMAGGVDFGLSSESIRTAVQPNPGLFALDGSGAGQGAILIANSSLVAAPASSIPGVASRPAKRGEYLSIFCTGLGEVSNRPPSGSSPGALAYTTVKPAVTVGGVTADVLFSGLAPGFTGLYQVDVQVPQNAPVGAATPVRMTVGASESNTVTIAVE